MTLVRTLCWALVIMGCSIQAGLVLAHGRLIEPASRNAAWRYGFDVPPNYNENGQNCGGFGVQWSADGNGRCGVCGDAYNGPQPHVYPGKYALGVKTKTYTSGQVIQVKVDITASHMGYIEFRLGKLDAPPVSQSKLTHLLKLTNGETRWFFTTAETKVYIIELKLPDDVACDHCVLQWWWRAGNSWGCEHGKCGLGYGPQETYANCADIKITPSSSSVNSTQTETGVAVQSMTAPTQMVATADEIKPSSQEIGSSEYTEQSTTFREAITYPITSSNIYDNVQSTQNAAQDTGNSQQQTTTTFDRNMKLLAKPFIVMGCRALGTWEGNLSQDQWCYDNCSRGYCPAQHCVCAYNSELKNSDSA